MLVGDNQTMEDAIRDSEDRSKVVEDGDTWRGEEVTLMLCPGKEAQTSQMMGSGRVR